MLHAALGCWQSLVARRKAKSAVAALARRRALLRCMRGWRAWAADTAHAPAAWVEEEDLQLSMLEQACAVLKSPSTAVVRSAGAWEACRSEDAEKQAVCRRMQARHNCLYATLKPVHIHPLWT